MKEDWKIAEEKDFGKMYRRRRCYIDTDSVVWHDYSDLEEYPDVEMFLDDYRESGFIEIDCGEKGELASVVRSITIETLRRRCNHCEHSKRGREGKDKKIYCLPNNREGCDSCPLEEAFSKGFAVQLTCKRESEKICNHCGERNPGWVYSNSKVVLDIFDVRLKGHPTVLSIERGEEVCPKCRQRIFVSRIPLVQIDLKKKMSVRLIYAILNRHSKDAGIADPCKKHIAQGYGISEELMKKFCSEAYTEAREKAEKEYLRHLRAKSESEKNKERKNVFCIPCGTTFCSMSLFFETRNSEDAQRELYLCAAIEKDEVDAIDAWLHGDFSSTLPAGMTDTHLNFVAGHCASVFLPNVDQLLAFRMVQLVVAYGKFLKSGRFAEEDPGITEMLKSCLRGLSVGDISPWEFKQRIDDVAAWSAWARKGRIFLAAKSVLVAMKTFEGNPAAPFLGVGQALPRPPVEDEMHHAKRIADYIERSLEASAKWQAISGEESEGCYGTNCELAILRLLYINSAVRYDPEQGSYLGVPRYGVAAAELEVLLKDGLLDDRGRWGVIRKGRNTPGGGNQNQRI